MPKITVKRNSQLLHDFEFEENTSLITIGAAEDNDIVISDGPIADIHLGIKKVRDSYFVESFEVSYNVFLNGRPLLKPCQIVHGDEISIGDYSLVFDKLFRKRPVATFVKEFGVVDENLLEEQSQVRASSKSHDDGELFDWELFKEDELFPLTEQGQSDPVEDLQPEKRQEGKLDSAYYLVAIYGPYLGKKFRLKPGDTRIGRDTKLNDIVIRYNDRGELDASISRRHATVRCEDGRFFVIDKRSKTRTYVNQKEVDPTEVVPVALGDEIEIVSDQKSTIFRLVSQESLDFGPPKKAGSWWIRNGLKVLATVSLALCFIGFASIGASCKKTMAISQKPDPLTLEEEVWYMDPAIPAAEAGKPTGAPNQMFGGQLALADLSGDGTLDVVLVDRALHVVALDGASKMPFWTNVEFVVNPNVPLVIEDLNRNRIPDILAVDTDGRLHALEGLYGAEIWESRILGDGISGPPVVGDFNGDGLKDVLICTEEGIIHIGYGKVNSMSWKSIAIEYPIHSVPSAWDWDDSGSFEAFIGTDNGQMLIVDKSQNGTYKLFDFEEAVRQVSDSYEPGHKIRSPIVFAGSRRNRSHLLVGAADGTVLAIENKTVNFLWLDRLNREGAVTRMLPPISGDLNGDGNDEVILISSDVIRAKTVGFETITSGPVLWEIPTDALGATPATASLADLNKDGADDLVLADSTGSIFILDGRDGETLARVSRGDLAALPPILVGDLGNDGYVDLVFRRSDLNIYRVRTNSKLPKGAVIWGQLFANSRHWNRLGYKLPRARTETVRVLFWLAMMAGLVFINIRPRLRRQRLIQRNQRR